jgi:hypothetical protein
MMDAETQPPPWGVTLPNSPAITYEAKAGGKTSETGKIFDELPGPGKRRQQGTPNESRSRRQPHGKLQPSREENLRLTSAWGEHPIDTCSE